MGSLNNFESRFRRSASLEGGEDLLSIPSGKRRPRCNDEWSGGPAHVSGGSLSWVPSRVLMTAGMGLEQIRHYQDETTIVKMWNTRRTWKMLNCRERLQISRMGGPYGEPTLIWTLDVGHSAMLQFFLWVEVCVFQYLSPQSFVRSQVARFVWCMGAVCMGTWVRKTLAVAGPVERWSRYTAQGSAFLHGSISLGSSAILCDAE
jgi:hypothetical protein